MSGNVHNWAFPEQQLKEHVAQRQANAGTALFRRPRRKRATPDPVAAPRADRWGSRMLAWLRG